ncbi:hypothetical protein CEW46_28665 [Bacillus cereus]|nr:hypothetical protein CEW46_28665 [Bacillus cereus]
MNVVPMINRKYNIPIQSNDYRKCYGIIDTSTHQTLVSQGDLDEDKFLRYVHSSTLESNANKIIYGITLEEFTTIRELSLLDEIPTTAPRKLAMNWGYSSKPHIVKYGREGAEVKYVLSKGGYNELLDKLVALFDESGLSFETFVSTHGVNLVTGKEMELLRNHLLGYSISRIKEPSEDSEVPLVTINSILDMAILQYLTLVSISTGTQIELSKNNTRELFKQVTGMTFEESIRRVIELAKDED